MIPQKKILIVDDEPFGRQLLESVIISEGYEIFFGSDGREAIEMAKSHKPDLILLDVMMPDLDGFEACRQIKEINEFKSTPIFLITALEDKDSKLKGLAAGANDYISKPFNRTEILSKIKNILDVNSEISTSVSDSEDDIIKLTIEKSLDFRKRFNRLLPNSLFEIKGKPYNQNSAFWIHQIENETHLCFLGDTSNHRQSNLFSLIFSCFTDLLYSLDNRSPKSLIENLQSELDSAIPESKNSILSRLWMCYIQIQPEKELITTSGLNYNLYHASKEAEGENFNINKIGLKQGVEHNLKLNHIIWVINNELLCNLSPENLEKQLSELKKKNTIATQPSYFASLLKENEMPKEYMAFQIVYT